MSYNLVFVRRVVLLLVSTAILLFSGHALYTGYAQHGMTQLTMLALAGGICLGTAGVVLFFRQNKW